jgi:hypothetical protein
MLAMKEKFEGGVPEVLPGPFEVTAFNGGVASETEAIGAQEIVSMLVLSNQYVEDHPEEEHHCHCHG